MKLASQRSRNQDTHNQNTEARDFKYLKNTISPINKSQLNINEIQAFKRHQSLVSQFTYQQSDQELNHNSYQAILNLKMSKQNNENKNETFQKKYLQTLIKQKSSIQNVYSPKADIKNDFYTPQKSIEENFKFESTLQADKNGLISNQTASINNKNPFSNALRRNNTLIKIDRNISNFDFNLPQLYYGSVNKEQQQNSSIQNNLMLTKQIDKDTPQKDNGIFNRRNNKKSFSLVDIKLAFQGNKSNESSRYQSPLVMYNQDKSNSNLNQQVQFKARGSVPNINDQIKHLSNSNITQYQLNNQRIRIPSLNEGLTSTINYNDTQTSQSPSVPQFHSIRVTKKSLTQIKQQSMIEQVEQILESPMQKVELKEIPYNHNFTQKRRSRIFNPADILRRSDPNIEYFKQYSKLNLGQEDISHISNQSTQQYTPFGHQVFDNNTISNNGVQGQFSQRNIIVQENGQIVNFIKKQDYKNYENNPNGGDITPTSLKDIDQSQSKQIIDNQQQPKQISPVELIAAYNQGDKKLQNQIQHKQELLKTIQKKIPRFIKQFTQKHPEYYEMIIICNQDLSFDQFCDKMGKFISFCLDRTSVNLNSFKTIRMSLGLSESILTFLQDFFIENNMNKQFYNEFCGIYRENYHQLNLNAGNLLLEIGGKRRVEAIIQNIVQKVEKQYDISLKQKINTLVDFCCYLLSGSKEGVDAYIKDFKNLIQTYGGVVNSSMYTSQDFFRIKFLLFSELYNDKDIPWKMKILIINEFEKLRYKYFRELHGLGDSISYYDLAQKIQQSMCELHWIRIGFLSKKNDDRRNFLVDLVKIIIEGEDGLVLKKYLENNYVTINRETIFMIESLVKGVLNQEKILPLITKKDFDYKFQKIKKILGLESSQNYLISNVEKISNDVAKWIQQNNLINKISEELSKRYEDLEYFFLLLISSCEDSCLSHLSDSLYAQEILQADLQQIQQQAKALKRVLIQTHINAGNSESTKYMTDIGVLITNLIKFFTDFKSF